MYKKISLISPYLEVQLRKLYWNNVKLLKKFRPRRSIAPEVDVSWDKVICYLKQNGIKNGTLLIVHSSYRSLKSSNLSPEELNASLRALVGDEGTLAMPVIRRHRGEPKLEDTLKLDVSDLICTYDTHKSEIWTGALPLFLVQERDVVISRHPLNSMAAVGRLAGPMMANNIDDDYSPPCGKNSSWAFCVENDAIVVGLGIDLSHSLTIRLVAEDLYMDEWPVQDWYRKRIFDVIDGHFKKRINVLERRPHWGCFYLAEMNFRKDLIENKIMHSQNVGGLMVETVRARQLIDFVRSRKERAYPYCVPKRYFK